MTLIVLLCFRTHACKKTAAARLTPLTDFHLFLLDFRTSITTKPYIPAVFISFFVLFHATLHEFFFFLNIAFN